MQPESLCCCRQHTQARTQAATQHDSRHTPEKVMGACTTMTPLSRAAFTSAWLLASMLVLRAQVCVCACVQAGLHERRSEE